MHALAQQQVALLVVLDRQLGLERLHLAVAQLFQDDVLFELNANNISFWMVRN